MNGFPSACMTRRLALHMAIWRRMQCILCRKRALRISVTPVFSRAAWKCPVPCWCLRLRRKNPCRPLHPRPCRRKSPLSCRPKNLLSCRPKNLLSCRPETPHPAGSPLPQPAGGGRQFLAGNFPERGSHGVQHPVLPCPRRREHKADRGSL